MLTLHTLTSYLDELLSPHRYNDYCPNGLQVEGRGDISLLVTGVTASRALIEAAIAKKADALLVHHGYFWKGEPPCLVGVQADRIRLLMKHDIHLLAYHLPLDAHYSLGNNAQLAQHLCLKVKGTFPIAQTKAPIGFMGRFLKPRTPSEVTDIITEGLGRKPLYLSGGEKAPSTIQSVGWCSGAAQDFIVDAAKAKLDAYITGEVSERTFHMARECGIHFYAAGHHATERYGVQAIGEHLVKTFPGLEHCFIDIPNPV